MRCVGQTAEGLPVAQSCRCEWLSQAQLRATLGVDLCSERFNCDTDERTLQRDRLNDGVPLLVTNLASG